MKLLHPLMLALQVEGKNGKRPLSSSNVVVPLPPLLMVPLTPLEQPSSASGQPQATSSPGFDGSEGLRFASKVPLLRPNSVHPLPSEGSAHSQQPTGDVLEGRALFLLSSTNPFRIFLAKVCNPSWNGEGGGYNLCMHDPPLLMCYASLFVCRLFLTRPLR